MLAQFIHLHIHTEFSLIDGIVRIKPLLAKIQSQSSPAVAITDQSNLFGMIKFYKAATSAGIKPIIGTEIFLENPKDKNRPFCLVLLCQNLQGYRNLSILLSKAYHEGQYHGKAIIQLQWLEALSEGLIALSSGLAGDIGQALIAEDRVTAEKEARYWQALFPNRFYIELSRVQAPQEERYIHAAVKLAEKLGLPVVATNNVRFINAEDFEAHEARVCIHEGYVLADTKRPRHYTEQQYLKSPEEMIALFSDIPEAIENTVAIAKRCNLSLSFGEYFLPDFPTPNHESLEHYLETASTTGLKERLAILFDLNVLASKENTQVYYDRLERELGVINQMGFAGYFLIVADFIQWAKNNDVPVGPGRGSGAGSLVAYALKITDLDPLQYDLLFERFLNPERVSMPDFDIDFCMEGRDRVIEYVAEKYGRESVSQIITYGTMAAKAVVRDVGRILNHPYGFVDKIAKMIPFEIGMTLEKALTEPALKEYYEQDEEVRAIIDLAKKLEGVARNVGKHAGGVVISPGPLTNFTPLYREEGSNQNVTQFDKDDIETIGLIKFDFLGLRTLTIIDWALKAVNTRLRKENKPSVDITLIPLNDTISFDLLKRCETTAVFQLESRGMKDLIKRLQPDCFEDIVALVALFRPGPLQSGMVDDFIDRKHGRAKSTYLHPALEPILKPTYGVILYQEQVMQIAQVLAGYSLGDADILRRAMGKKKPEEMAKQREIFSTGAEKNGVDGDIARQIFDLMEKFAGYGFNKSHSAAYALIAYQTAWLKAHYPAEFMAAVLSSDMDNTDKVVIFFEECQAMKLTVKAPDVNKSQYPFSVDENGDILYGLGAIKGVGESALDNIIQLRESNGAFKSFYQFCQLVDSRKVTKRVLESLIKSGAMDVVGPYRAAMLESLPTMMQAAEQHERNQTQNQNDLFGATHDDEEKHHLEPEFAAATRLPNKVRLQYEKETLGFYLSGHPFADIAGETQHMTTCSLDKVNQHVGNIITIAGLINGVRTIKTKRGKRMAIITLDDCSARVDVLLFSETFEKNRDLLKTDNIVIIDGEVSVDDFSGGYRITCREICDLEAARSRYGKRLRIELNRAHSTPDCINNLAALLQQHPGELPITIFYTNQNALLKLPLGQQWKIKPSDSLLEQLYEYTDKNAVGIIYA